MATTGYAAGIEANSTQLSYGLEATFATLPAVQFQAIRYTGETLSGNKTRQRPSEINLSREAAQGVTVSESAAGTISGALSFGTYDDFMASCLNNSWQAAQVINGVGGDITITNLTGTTATLSSTTANKFQNLNVGQWVRLLGFTNTTNNGLFRVTAKASNLSLTVVTPGGATVTETPTGTNAKVRASTIQNGSSFQSLYIQQQYASNLFLRYPGSYINGMSISAALGQFVTCSLNVIATQEQSSTTTASTGAILAAPTGAVHDSVGSFGGVYFDDALISGVVDSCQITISNDSAAAEYGLGSAIAQGMLSGNFTVSGSIKIMFSSLTNYNYFKSETSKRITIVTRDGASGNAYAFTLPVAFLVNPRIQATAPGTVVFSEFDLEGAPQAGGGSLIIDRLPNT